MPSKRYWLIVLWSTTQLQKYVNHTITRVTMSNNNMDCSTTTPVSSLKIKNFTYPGWKEDYCYIQEHMVSSFNIQSNHTAPTHHPRISNQNFRDRLLGMINRQRLFNGDRSHDQIVELDKLRKTLSYHGWQTDVEHAERMHVRFPSLFDSAIAFLANKQRLLGATDDGVVSFSINATKRNIPSKTDKNSNLYPAEDSSCIICLQSKREYAFVPCGHLCICNDCSICVANLDSRCPICRCDATHVMKIFN